MNQKVPKQTLSIEQLIEKFWLGEECLTGTSDWWKFEVCYGRTVNFYSY